jgi:Dissimilatory sulfite reductase (desulfoviridin), alpha and beta subunits
MRKKRSLIFYIGLFAALAVAGMGCSMAPAGAYLEVDSAKCIGCARCMGVCQVDAVRIIDGKAVIDPTKCVKCGKCVEICPVNAVY